MATYLLVPEADWCFGVGNEFTCTSHVQLEPRYRIPQTSSELPVQLSISRVVLVLTCPPIQGEDACLKGLWDLGEDLIHDTIQELSIDLQGT